MNARSLFNWYMSGESEDEVQMLGSVRRLSMFLLGASALLAACRFARSLYSRIGMPQKFPNRDTAIAIDVLLQPCPTTKRSQNRLSRGERFNVTGINSKLLHIHRKCRQLKGHARSC